MKKVIFVIFFLPIILLGCLNSDFEPTDWALEPKLEFSKSTVLFNSTLSIDSVAIETNYQKFDATCNESWCTVSIDKSKSAIEIKAEPNIDVHQRSAIVVITISRGNKSLSKNISVVQMGGVWETIGDFNVYWGYEISESQRDAIVELLTNMTYVNGGSFVMGNTDELIVDGTHPHTVLLSGFYIGKFEVTQKQWRVIMGNNPSTAKGENIPIYNISWVEALEFTTRLADLTNLTIKLPTEAQWEFAAKGGNHCAGYIYSGGDDYSTVAVYNNTTYSQEPSTIGTLKGNEIGLYDMSGNVAEYCRDWWERDYEDPNNANPIGPNSGTFKCVRGGHVNSNAPGYLRLTNRNSRSNSINKITPYTGIRIVVLDETI